MSSDWVLLLSCEHAGYKVPKHYMHQLDAENQALLSTHRGWDRGALVLAKEISKLENAPLFFTEISRLLIDCNRSLNHKNCFGPAFRELSAEVKEQIAADYYHPYRNSLVESIQRLQKQGAKVLHLAFHSFTPELNGRVRNAEFGILYDPCRASELAWANAMMKGLKAQEFPWRVRRNYPYLGKADGFTRYLRSKFSDEIYAGFELEFNQKLFVDPVEAKRLAKVTANFVASLDLKTSE